MVLGVVVFRWTGRASRAGCSCRCSRAIRCGRPVSEPGTSGVLAWNPRAAGATTAPGDDYHLSRAVGEDQGAAGRSGDRGADVGAVRAAVVAKCVAHGQLS